MDFKSLVNQRVEISARVQSIGTTSSSNVDMVVLGKVYINGVFFRDHSYIKMTKRLKDIRVGDNITATAKLIEYISVDTNKKDKLGFRTLRNVQVIT